MKIRTYLLTGALSIGILTFLITSFLSSTVPNGMFIGLGTGFLILLIFLWIVSRIISRPIIELQQVVEQLLKGDMNATIATNGVTELNDLIDSFKKIFVSLKLAVMRVGLTAGKFSVGKLFEEKEMAEKQLKTSEEFVHSILQHSGIPIVAYHDDGTLMSANSDFFEITGYSKEDVETKDVLFKNAFPSEMVSEKMNKVYARFHQGQKVDDFVIPLRCKDGSTVITVSNITLLHDDSGKVIGEALFMRDLSEIFNLEEQIRFWAANGFTQVSPLGKKKDSGIEITPTVEHVDVHER